MAPTVSIRTPRIYLTGFGPFADVNDNPSARVAEALDQVRVGRARVEAEVLPVSFERAAALLVEGYQRLRPELAVHLGVATRRRLLSIEDRAHNVMDARIPDVDGKRPHGQAIDPAAATDMPLRSRIDTRRLTDNLVGHGVPARLSRDAGRYVCNRVYHQGLTLGAQCQPPCRVVFLHLPPIGAHHRQGAQPWTLEDLRRSVLLVLQALRRA
jgi:pyroglutamyl-peptidase